MADLWGYKQADMDGFDPLIDLLLGACAVEFERTGNQIVSSQSRILEKLAHLLLPESLTIPRPAHAVMHASAVEPRHTLKTVDQFSFDKEVVNPAKPTEVATKSVFFSPTSPLTILDGNIRYLGFGNRLMEYTTTNLREQLAVTKRDKKFSNQEVWLGIKLSRDLKELSELTFFFDWASNPDKEKYFNLLPLTRISVGEVEMKIKSGYSTSVEDRISKLRRDLIGEWDILPKIEDQVNQLYEHHFITASSSSLDIKHYLSKYPSEFENHFDTKALDKFDEKLLWCRITLPQLIPQKAIEEMQCAINCFPVCNRQFVDNRRPYRLDKSLNIVPLKVEDYFLSVNEVTSGRGKPMQAVPFYNIQQLEPGTFAIRKERVARFDQRNAKEMLNYVLELMRDEAAAFAATSATISSKDVIELEQQLNRIENNLAKKTLEEDVDQYLVLKPGKARDVYVSYWTTTGAQGNQVPAGSQLKTRSVDFNSSTLVTMTTSYGGKNKPSEQEKLFAFRSNLLSRGRIVTREDLKAACYAELGDSIAHVEVKKGFENASSTKQGLMRVLDVFLTPSEQETLAEDEWAKISAELAMSLERRSSIFLPIRVRVVQPVNS